MTNALGDRSSTQILTAQQLGTPSNHVKTAYIDNIIPAPGGSTPTLQQVCDTGSTTTTDVTLTTGILNTTKINTTAADRLIIEGRVSIGNSLTPNYELEIQGQLAPTIEIKDLPFNSILRLTAFDQNSTIKTVGAFPLNLQVNSQPRIEMKTNNRTVFYNSSGLDCFNVNGATDDVAATRGDLICTAGNVTATVGGVLAPVGNSQLNRLEYTTSFGGTTAALPLSVAPQSITPLRVFTLPTGTFQLTVFLTNSQASAQEFAFEVHNLPTNILRDYQLVMSAQTYDNAGGLSLGFNGIVIGEAISAPTDTTKVTCVFNVAQPYVAQKIKCNVRFEYSPSP
jgi:hypothetical protein